MIERKDAVLGFGSVVLESALIETLQNLGWNIVFRTYIADSLLQFVGSHSPFYLFYDRSWLTEEQLEVILRSPQVLRAIPIDGNISEEELIRRIADQDSSSKHKYHMPDLSSIGNIEIFGSAYSGVGASTIALSYAHLLSEAGKKVLFLDCNSTSPFATSLFDLRRLDINSHQLSSGLKILEFTPDNYQSTTKVSEELSQTDNLIVDCGIVRNIQRNLHAQRVQDRIITWLFGQSQRLHFMRSHVSHLSYLVQDSMHELESLQFSKHISVVTNFADPSSLRKYNESYLPRDFKSMETAIRERNVLTAAAPRSPLASAITRYARTFHPDIPKR